MQPVTRTTIIPRREDCPSPTTCRSRADPREMVQIDSALPTPSKKKSRPEPCVPPGARCLRLSLAGYGVTEIPSNSLLVTGSTYGVLQARSAMDRRRVRAAQPKR